MRLVGSGVHRQADCALPLAPAERRLTWSPYEEVPMALGYDKPLYLMAFDHRGSFEKDLFGSSEPVPADVRDGIIGVKQIIFDAHRQALLAGAPREYCGVLVDEEFGAGVARRAKEEGVVLAMPVERSGQEEFEFQYGEDFGAHIEAFDPTFAKVLVRYNPDGEPD